mgnify:CR=1 FL=1
MQRKLEAELATGIKIEDEESLFNACVVISKLTEADIVIVTLSQDGVALYENKTLKIIPTEAKEILDVTGAGDTFLASLAYYYMKEKQILIAISKANKCALKVVSERGVSVV